jgi:hypothetical protein
LPVVRVERVLNVPEVRDMGAQRLVLARVADAGRN